MDLGSLMYKRIKRQYAINLSDARQNLSFIPIDINSSSSTFLKTITGQKQLYHFNPVNFFSKSSLYNIS